MRKFLTVCVSMLLLTACGPTPNAGTTGNGTNTGTGGNASATANATASKSAYIAALTCIKNKTADASQKNLIDIQIAAVNAVPESSWAAMSASVTAQYNVWLQAVGGSCN